MHESLNKKAIFSRYYKSERFGNELCLPEKPSFHHFRFERFDSRRFVRLRDIIRNKEILKTFLAKECPRNIFFSPVKWLDPLNIRKKKDETVKDYMLSSTLYFDIDCRLIQQQTLEAAISNTHRLVDYIENEYGRKPDWIVFSGNEGFHIYYWEWDAIPRRYDSPGRRIEEFIKSRKKILAKLDRNHISVDSSVTADPWRILRVPGTLHGDTCLIAKVFEKLENFSLEKTRPNSLNMQ